MDDPTYTFEQSTSMDAVSIVSNFQWYKNLLLKIGICGASGCVGTEIVRVLEELDVPLSQIILFTSSQSAGKEMYSYKYGGILRYVEFDFTLAKSLDVVFLAATNSFSLEWAEQLSKAGVKVIDSSSAFRLHPDVPLVIPECNIHKCIGKNVIASPNCVTTIALMALYPIHLKYTLKRVIVSTYQAASGAGKEGMDELIHGINTYGEKQCEQSPSKIFQYPLVCNIIPHIDEFTSNGYTKEEMKIVNEMHKILDTTNILISATTVRIPTIRSHAISITIETEQEINADDVRTMLQSAVGLDVIDDPMNKKYPMPITSTYKHNVEVGRIRENNVFGKHGLDLFMCGDQILRGAALNAVLIMRNM